NMAAGLRIDVQPGDATVVAGGDLDVLADIRGGSAGHVVIEYTDEGSSEPVRVVMNRVEERFAATLRHIASPRRYRIVAVPEERPSARIRLRDPGARPAVSHTYRIDTVVPPGIDRLDAGFEFPEYLGRAAETVESLDGDIKVPCGTHVTLRGRSTKPLAWAALHLGEEEVIAEIDGPAFETLFDVRESVPYQILLRDEAGFENVGRVTHSIVAVPDRPPVVALLAPARDLSVLPAAVVPIVFAAEDDYALTAVRVYAACDEEAGADVAAQEPLASYTGGRLGQKARFEGTFELDLARMAPAPAPGDVVRVWVDAVDNLPGEGNQGRSRTVNIRVYGGEGDEAALRDLIGRIEAVLQKQELLNARVGDVLRGLVASKPIDDGGRQAVEAAVPVQEEVRVDVNGIAADAPMAGDHAADVARVMRGLAEGEIADALAGLGRLAQADAGGAGSDAGQVMKAQALIVEKLEDLLRLLNAAASAGDGPGGADVEEPAGQVAEEDVREQVEEALQSFAAAQRRALEQTNNLSPKAVDDLTAEEKDEFRAMAVAEDELSDFLEELISDLSELPSQDFSNSTLRDEVVEILAEVELAEDALELENRLMAISAEQVGLELAEELIHDLPRWLSDVPDTLKWDLEEPPEDYEAPMAELPDELYDMMGELIETEEDMIEEIEDESSSWADSIDAGAGWMAMDGPISNMSAKGITGNLMPNSSEIGGRSGEGRTGRAHGEFVEKTASGKGGRDTPTRLSPDAFEEGIVEDSSTDPMGGATGGGKLSGSGGYGLPGPLPPEVQNSMQRLAGQQADLRAKAERLQFKLRVVNIPLPALDESIGVMREIEDDLRSYRYQDVLPKKQILLDTMRESRSHLSQHITIRGEQPVFLPERNQQELLEALDEEVVPEYRDMVADYFRTLAESRP
ncbi:MAG: hypothetical protein JXR94_08140, partial [Candidatus Hydrogenedentes bacterium]|nr:hypothetical protein [Candidatus Hydrogenedentota bacterium]